MFIANLPPHDGKPVELETAFGRATECRLLRADPTFVAELTLVDNIAAQQFLAKYHKSSNPDGRVLDISAEDQHIAQLNDRIVECRKCATEVCS